MVGLRIRLLGAPEILLDGQPIEDFRTGKAQALLCYLAVSERPHTRSALATLLWGDLSEANARVNLSKALSDLRRLIGDHIVVRRDLISLDMVSDLAVDVIAFRRCCASMGGYRPPVDRLHEALTLYRGPFLDGFTVRNAPDLELWITDERQRLHECAVQALQDLIAIYDERSNWSQAIATTRRLLMLEPWREEAHCTLMALLARTGQRGVALAQYEVCRAALSVELGVAPSAATEALYAQIVAADRAVQPDSKQEPFQGSQETTMRFVAGPPITDPRRFFGRAQELTRIFHWLKGQPMTHVAIIGQRRSGKTSLLHYLRTDRDDAGIRPAAPGRSATGCPIHTATVGSGSISKMRVYAGRRRCCAICLPALG